MTIHFEQNYRVDGLTGLATKVSWRNDSSKFKCVSLAMSRRELGNDRDNGNKRVTKRFDALFGFAEANKAAADLVGERR